MTRIHGRYGILGAVFVCGSMSGIAATAPNDRNVNDGELAEVIVTARKRTESVQDVSSSIRAISGDELARLGADSIQDYAAITPGLQLSGSANNTQLVIRGVTTGPVNHDQSEIQSTVGLYLDEAPIAVQRYSPNLKLYDLERIEVLRGPQGTLYGAGSMSGAVRMITRKPNLQEFDASSSLATSTVTNGGTNYSFDGMVNVPLIENTLAARAVVFYRHDAGYIDNVVDGSKGVNSADASGGRISVQWVASDKLSIGGLLFLQDQNLRAAAYYAPEAGDLKTLIVGREPSRDKDIIGSITATYQAEYADLTVVASHLQKNLTYFLENGSFTNYITGFRDGLGGTFVNLANQRNSSIEVRLASKPSSTIEWTVGAFYEKALNFYGQDFTVPGVDAVAKINSGDYGANPNQLFFSSINHNDKQLALFGESVLPITSQLKLTVGGRYFNARQASIIDFRGVFAYPAIGVQAFRNTESGFNPKVNLSYQISADHLVYVQAAKGFRLGGTNEPVPVPYCQKSLTDAGFTKAPDTFRSDSLWDYELGTKTQWLERRLTVNAAVYKIKWRNPQVTAQLPCGFNVFVNAGGLDILGGELEVAAHPLSGLTVRAAVGHTDSKLSDDLRFLSAHKGDSAPYTAKQTYSGTIDYRRPVAKDVEGFGFLEYQYQGARNTAFNTTASNVPEMGGYGVVSGRLGLSFSKWSAALYGDNLANKRGVTNIFNNPFHLNPATDLTVIVPRTIGVRVDAHW